MLISQLEENDTLNIREELENYLIHWKWFVLFSILSLLSCANFLLPANRLGYVVKQNLLNCLYLILKITVWKGFNTYWEKKVLPSKITPSNGTSALSPCCCHIDTSKIGKLGFDFSWPSASFFFKDKLLLSWFWLLLITCKLSIIIGSDSRLLVKKL